MNFVDRSYNEHEYKHAIHLLIDETHIFSVIVVRKNTVLEKKIQVQCAEEYTNEMGVQWLNAVAGIYFPLVNSDFMHQSRIKLKSPVTVHRCLGSVKVNFFS